MSHFQKLAKMNYFLAFLMYFSTQNVNVARFARNLNATFWVIFKHSGCGLLKKTNNDDIFSSFRAAQRCCTYY